MALSERLATDQAQEANVRLKKRLRKNLKLANRLKGVMAKQIARFQIVRWAVGDLNDAAYLLVS